MTFSEVPELNPCRPRSSMYLYRSMGSQQINADSRNFFYQQDKHKMTRSMYAASNKYLDTATLLTLLAKGIQFGHEFAEIQNTMGDTIFHILAKRRGTLSVIKLLIENEANFNIPNKQNRYPISILLANSMLDYNDNNLPFILESASYKSVITLDTTGLSALHYFVKKIQQPPQPQESQNFDIVLKHLNFNIHVKDFQGKTVADYLSVRHLLTGTWRLKMFITLREYGLDLRTYDVIKFLSNERRPLRGPFWDNSFHSGDYDYFIEEIWNQVIELLLPFEETDDVKEFHEFFNDYGNEFIPRGKYDFWIAKQRMNYQYKQRLAAHLFSNYLVKNLANSLNIPFDIGAYIMQFVPLDMRSYLHLQ